MLKLSVMHDEVSKEKRVWKKKEFFHHSIASSIGSEYLVFIDTSKNSIFRCSSRVFATCLSITFHYLAAAVKGGT